ncbi:MAG: hypothetical protein GEU83_07185 [Pseudonocardiaceae bacterium]|nr:hypothetical protein [Pseudonocardiaceae bacterium]
MADRGVAAETATTTESMTRIVLRPITSPLALGFLALGGATLVLSGLQLGWYGPGESTAVALALMLFGFPLQLLASIFGFLARDIVAATGMGVLAASWLTAGAVMLLTPPGSTSGALGVLLIFAGIALVIPALAASFGKVVPALVLFTASVRFILTGIHQLSGAPAVEAMAGIMGLALLALALYAALALGLEDVRRKTVLPVLRVGMGREALRGTPAEQVAGVEHEAGVREQL